MRALIIRPEPLEQVLAGEKTWEIRGRRCRVRGEIALIAKGTGKVVGCCDLLGCQGPLTAEEFRRNARKAGLRPAEAKLGYYRTTFAWVLGNVRRVEPPVPYRHPSGAVIWVQLTAAVSHKLETRVS